MISSWSEKVKSPRTVEQLTLKQTKSCMFQLERSLFFLLRNIMFILEEVVETDSKETKFYHYK